MAKYRLLFIFVLLISLEASACRFTVREIGFSILSQDIYTLTVIDANANPADSFWKSYHTKNRDCNVRLEVLNPVTDAEHPVVLNAKSQGISFPATILVAPDKRIYEFHQHTFDEIYRKVYDSMLREQMRLNFSKVFAVVFWVNGLDDSQNRAVEKKVQQECSAIENIMPSMPKIVKNGPLSIDVSVSDWEDEKLLLWSLGIDSLPDEPIAFVIYGRGRMIGEALNYQQILDGGLYKYMSMIGADCECGLDKKWMLGHQIPLLWPEDSRQQLVKLLGFDVDNPMILAEMSRILTKEKLNDATGSVAFAPESIDLDEIFGNSATEEKMPELQTSGTRAGRTMLITLIGLLVSIVVIGFILIYKKRASGD